MILYMRRMLTRGRHPVPRLSWRLVAIESAEVLAWGVVLGGVVRADWSVVTAGLALACYVELKKWGRL